MHKFTLIVMFLMGFAAHAAAQGVAFTSTSLPRLMRLVGQTEAAGEEVLIAINVGTILAGSFIDITYSAEVTNNSTVSTNNISLANNISCFGPSGGTACPTSASLVGGQAVRMLFASSKSFVSDDQINISRVRVNASTAAGVGSVTATFSAASPNPVNNPITVTDPVRQVGVPIPAISVNFNHSTATPNPVTLFQTCAFPNDAANDFFIRVNELYPGALTTMSQETVFSPNLAPINGIQITIAILNVPAGLTLAYTGTQLTTGLLTAGAALPAASVDQTVGGSPIVFIFNISASDTSQVERTTFNFSLKPTTMSTTNPLPIANVGAPVNVQGTVQITPITSTDSTIVRFVANQIGPTTLATISDVCPPPRVQPSRIISE
ncbi:MAG: hypothetical protein EXQ56_13450 [Acidobacteria bacterium]|nr:hypothetical protein [Acidobacteriota bacterium]